MLESTKVAPTYRFAFVTLDNYSMIALSSAIEPLRMANHLSRREVYQWVIVTLDGQPAVASNGMSMGPTVALDDMGPVNIVFVCGGIKVKEAVTPPLLHALRRFAQRHIPIGSLCTGSYALAKAGVLEKHRVAIHWENMAGLLEEFPGINFTEKLFSIGYDRYTCSGGVAPLDLMLHLIREHLGHDIASAISEQFIVERIRDDNDRQRVPLQSQVGSCHENLLKVASLMESNIEEPLSLDELADEIGISRRQIERLFKRYLNCVPTKYYLDLRLRRARELLLQTSMSILDITIACGFQSPPHFSKCYRGLFGYPPSAERVQTRSKPALASSSGPLLALQH
ncbi:MAG TPA: GlxA family transcriptional regulator [Aromatoleum sp.]|uniref:GlxA family transcriptional regulator n=1 Tax=Aromatoleum sp. TaxID=2307007 RepID=UPI002B48D831|nr:GlxA family transcriptional regulator [Aromatoleum sp.]HJV25053.1 GlxA family transcriptional regulator [Aromatoleum sp.]